MRGCYGHSPLGDKAALGRSAIDRALTRATPGLYRHVRGWLGRDDGGLTSVECARYAQRCMRDYSRVLARFDPSADGSYAGRTVLEYGPGPTLAVALLLHARGAERVHAVDRFPLAIESELNDLTLRRIVVALRGSARDRGRTALRDRREVPASVDEKAIAYRLHPYGLSGLDGEADLVLSRAVLGNVSDLAATFADMRRALRPGGLALHKVDLGSYGYHRVQRLDFLSWPERDWQRLTSHRCAPNRLRVDAYRRLAAETGLETLLLERTSAAAPDEIAAVRPHLAEPFRELTDEDLSWLGFWLVLRRPAA